MCARSAYKCGRAAAAATAALPLLRTRVRKCVRTQLSQGGSEGRVEGRGRERGRWSADRSGSIVWVPTGGQQEGAVLAVLRAACLPPAVLVQLGRNTCDGTCVALVNVCVYVRNWAICRTIAFLHVVLFDFSENNCKVPLTCIFIVELGLLL